MAAAQFSGATLTSHHAPYRSHAYTKSTGYSPTNTTSNTPINVSPTSPRTSTHLPLQRHQGIYQPRVAIGVPAALRKTERPASKSPPKVDSGVGSPSSGWNFNSGLSQNATDGIARPLSQVGNEDMHSIYNDYPMSPTAGPITRNHWQADGSTSVCSASSCAEPFGFFQRRHHCRKCGGIFCWQHSAKQVRLDELARFHPEGQLHRACDRCYGSFREWEHLRTSRTNSESSGGSAASATVPVETPAPAKRPENPRVGSLAQSLQGAWNWSTF